MFSLDWSRRPWSSVLENKEMAEKNRRRLFRKLLLVAVVVILVAVGHNRAISGWRRVDDFVGYWSAARLQLNGLNPYSESDLLAIQRSGGWKEASPLISFNPPWTLAFVLPFGLFSYPVSRLIWLFLTVAAIVWSTDWAWRFYGGPPEFRKIAWLLGGFFLPGLMSLSMGQITPFVLLGVVGFLSFVGRRQWMGAGAALVLLAVKPHLFYLFWLALFFWMVARRSWSMLLGAAASLLMATSIACWFNPPVLAQYTAMIGHEAPPLLWLTPTLGTFLRGWFGGERSWLQFLPMLLGTVWFLLHWQRNRVEWDWTREMAILLLVSMATTSYTWMFDQVVLLPFILQALVWAFADRQRGLRVLALLGYTAANGVGAVMVILKVNHQFYVWMAWVWLIGYLYLRERTSPASDDPAAATSVGDLKSCGSLVH